MDVKRALEIYHSTGVIDVTYLGKPVWIEEVHEDDATANVSGVEENLNEHRVDVNDLVEGRGLEEIL